MRHYPKVKDLHKMSYADKFQINSKCHDNAGVGVGRH